MNSDFWFLISNFIGENNFEALEYSNSDKFVKYEGQVRDGKPHGRGKMTYRDGGFYSGEWQDGERHGTGTQTYSSGSERGSYEGMWKDDKEDGHGVIVLKNGEKYEGSMSNGVRAGKGLLTFPPNDWLRRVSLNGDWKDDKATGYGTFYWNNDSKYAGELVNYQIHGHGVETYSPTDQFNRVSFEGEFIEGKKVGNGTMIWKNGAKYIGGFSNDDLHGYGVEIFSATDESDRVRYEGEYKDGKKSGKGTMIWKNEKYVGEWLNGMRHGEGTLYSANNEIISQGHWEKDSFVGK